MNPARRPAAAPVRKRAPASPGIPAWADAPRNARLHRALAAWFATEQRSLPWRAARDPYRVWVSEIMAQQTRLGTMTAYYERFIARFPDAGALAAASPEDVNAAWSGLGYYSRARNLHRAAIMVVSGHGGEFPRAAAALRRLPGIGPYTAGAIASIAFGEPEATVDGNIARVFSRLFDISGPVDPGGGRTFMWEIARAALDRGNPGDWNQALMELGATICISGKPHCGSCPLRNDCLALAHGTVPLRPEVRKAPERRRIYWLACIVRDGRSRILLIRRPGKGILAGLYAPPIVELPSGENRGPMTGETVTIENMHLQIGEPMGLISHTLTHREISAAVHEAEIISGISPEPHAWAGSDDDLAQLGVPALTRRLLCAAAGPANFRNSDRQFQPPKRRGELAQISLPVR